MLDTEERNQIYIKTLKELRGCFVLYGKDYNEQFGLCPILYSQVRSKGIPLCSYAGLFNILPEWLEITNEFELDITNTKDLWFKNNSDRFMALVKMILRTSSRETRVKIYEEAFNIYINKYFGINGICVCIYEALINTVLQKDADFYNIMNHSSKGLIKDLPEINDLDIKYKNQGKYIYWFPVEDVTSRINIFKGLIGTILIG